MPRIQRLSERAMKAALSMGGLIVVRRFVADLDCQRRSFSLTRHYSIFYHKCRRVAVTDNLLSAFPVSSRD
jgi:hypothetical protein